MPRARVCVCLCENTAVEMSFPFLIFLGRRDVRLWVQCGQGPVPGVPGNLPQGGWAPEVPVALQEPVMMHDFAITERHAIFMDLPVVFEP